MRRAATGLSALLILSSTGCVAWREYRLAAGLRAAPPPDFELAALDGGSVRLSELKGKPVVLAFFSYG